jgi:anti-sigma-K factor RskA
VIGGGGNGEHARFGEDVAPWLLHALSADEQAAFERHLAACGRCREEVAALRPAVDALPLSAPPVNPPPELRDRIMRVVSSEAELLQAAGEEADRPAPPRRPRERRRRPVFASLRPALAAAAACAALAAGVIGYAIGNSGGGGGGGKVVAAKVTFPNARVSVRTQDGKAALQLANMPSPPRGRVYQVWLKRDGENPRPTRALFDVRSGSVSIPGGLGDSDQVLVTAEPRGGSPAPTSQPVVVANTA